MNARTVTSTAAAVALGEALAARRLVVICGTGVTASATRNDARSSWAGLIEDGIGKAVSEGIRDSEWADRCLGDVRSAYIADMIAAAEKVTSALNSRPGLFEAWLQETAGSLTVSDDSLPSALNLLAVAGARVITTNYDDVLTSALGWPAVVPQQGTDALRKTLRGQPNGVVHLHGHWSIPESVVFGSSSYARIVDNATVHAFMQVSLFADTVVYVGVGDGLADPNFLAFREWSRNIVGDSSMPHFRLALASAIPTLITEHDASENIRVASYGDTHADLPLFLGSILAAAPTRLRPAETPAIGAARPAAPGGLVPPMTAQRLNELKIAFIEARDSATSALAIAPTGEFTALFREAMSDLESLNTDSLDERDLASGTAAAARLSSAIFSVSGG